MLLRRLALVGATCAIPLALATQALAAPPSSSLAGSLKLCKTAGPGIAVGEPISFSVTSSVEVGCLTIGRPTRSDERNPVPAR